MKKPSYRAVKHYSTKLQKETRALKLELYKRRLRAMSTVELKAEEQRLLKD